MDATQTSATPTKPRSAINVMRTVAQSSLLGAVTAGMLLGWSPVAAAVDVHAIGAVVGAGLGAVGVAKHFI